MKKPEQSFFLGNGAGEATVLGKRNLMTMVLSSNLFTNLKNKFFYCNNI